MSGEQLLHHLSYGSEVFAYLTTVFFYARHKHRVSFLLLLLMSAIVIAETLGKFRHFFPSTINIFLIQNIEMLAEVLIFLLVYYFSVQSVRLRQWILLMLGVYLLFTAYASVSLQPLQTSFPTYSIVVGGIFLLVTILIYFYDGLKQAELYNFYRNYLFYISVGLFIFYANEIPVMTLLNYFLENNTAINKVPLVDRPEAGGQHYFLRSLFIWYTMDDKEVIFLVLSGQYHHIADQYRPDAVPLVLCQDQGKKYEAAIPAARTIRERIICGQDRDQGPDPAAGGPGTA